MSEQEVWMWVPNPSLQLGYDVGRCSLYTRDCGNLIGIPFNVSVVSSWQPAIRALAYSTSKARGVTAGSTCFKVILRGARPSGNASSSQMAWGLNNAKK